jgi:hypothetical protein
MDLDEVQECIDDYFLVGEIDYHFFFEFFDHFTNFAQLNFGIFNRFEKFPLNISKAESFERALKLSQFFIDSGAYAGFYMPHHKIPYCIYITYSEYEVLLREKNNLIPNYGIAQADENGYSLGVVKIIEGAKAPRATTELVSLFRHI